MGSSYEPGGSEYVRLSNGAASPTHAQTALPFSQGAYAMYGDSDDDLDHTQHRPRGFWGRLKAGWTQSGPQQEIRSEYLTLIPLSDSRLKPQRTNLIVGILLALALAAVCGVFYLVPRGVTVGTIEVHSSQISFNTSKSTYQILLTATIPVYNPNYLPVTLSGMINVSFYDQQAGSTPLLPVDVPARAQPEVITVPMDASSVPQKYLFTIYTQCFTFPEKLIFFLTGSITAEYLGKPFPLPPVDNYFIISCSQPDPDKPDKDKPDKDKPDPDKPDKDKFLNQTAVALPAGLGNCCMAAMGTGGRCLAQPQPVEAIRQRRRVQHGAGRGARPPAVVAASGSTAAVSHAGSTAATSCSSWCVVACQSVAWQDAALLDPGKLG